MPRTPSIPDRQILEAARATFLELGIRATTAEVARRAGVAEGTLFKRFKNKDDLFVACMEPGAIDDLPWIRTLIAGSTRSDVRAVLYKAGLECIAFFRKLLPLMMMSWSNSAQSGMPPHLRGSNPPPLRALKTVASFFESQIRGGRLRRHDPEILARMFISSMQNYAFTELLLKESDQEPLPVERYVRGVMNLLWSGAAPAAGARKRRSA
ncbi:MAG TPA: TetR/AcrR family transcriptional regulator [Polyangia bacterium]|nr:TetR/AcrR family transcriptional regulator [Polyangia bacterium]